MENRLPNMLFARFVESNFTGSAVSLVSIELVSMEEEAFASRSDSFSLRCFRWFPPSSWELQSCAAFAA